MEFSKHLPIQSVHFTIRNTKRRKWVRNVPEKKEIDEASRNLFEELDTCKHTDNESNSKWNASRTVKDNSKFQPIDHWNFIWHDASSASQSKELTHSEAEQRLHKGLLMYYVRHGGGWGGGGSPQISSSILKGGGWSIKKSYDGGWGLRPS